MFGGGAILQRAFAGVSSRGHPSFPTEMTAQGLPEGTQTETRRVFQSKRGKACLLIGSLNETIVRLPFSQIGN